jgi:hypothetical protein
MEIVESLAAVKATGWKSVVIEEGIRYEPDSTQWTLLSESRIDTSQGSESVGGGGEAFTECINYFCCSPEYLWPGD